MLRYFIENSSLQQVENICEALNQTKRRLEAGDFVNPCNEYDSCNELFEDILKIAVGEKDEKLANAQFVFKQYFLLFCNMLQYFGLLKKKEYKASWNKLQDCIDDAQYVGKFSHDRLEVPQLLDLLRSYEMLYPYRVFASSEYIVTRSHCSICGKSMQSLACSHIVGNLYWGKPAIEMVDEIKEFQAVCLVSHPEDKRCIIELADDQGQDEIEKFIKIDKFLDLNLPILQNFTINSVIETRQKEVEKVGRNDPCPCGSGLKFKKCCGKELYYKHERNIITPKNKVQLFYFN
jgi:uncharacterized protein YchJ